jgi:5-formyltetrahydrofolate cyclo-ligase
MDTAAEKQRLRTLMTSRRDAITPLERAGFSARFADRFLGFLGDHPAGTVSAFWPMRSELDPRPLMTLLAERGWRLALPRMHGAAKPLTFRLFDGDETSLVAGPFGVREPSQDAEVVRPDIVIAPMLAFDERGYRLGYGGGFYDRTLEQLRSFGPIIAVGAAFDMQRVDRIPVDDYDQYLAAVITEAKVYGKDISECAS